MKHEWKKKEKNIYLPKGTPTLVEIPKFKYITIEGIGNPNSNEFSDKIQSLYALSYGVKMNLKKDSSIKDYFEYTVYPLEGQWDLTEEGKEKYKDNSDITKLKEFLKYKIMIRQPDFVNSKIFESIKEIVYNKKKINSIKSTKFEDLTEGKVLQMLHIGPYDEEPKTFKIMEDFCVENNLKRLDKTHKEIYLSDQRKVTEDKLKTTLRFKV